MSQTIHLIGIGEVPAVPLSEVHPGDRLMWNFGTTSDVVSVTRKTAATFELVTRYADGQEFTQRKRGTTLVAKVAR